MITRLIKESWNLFITHLLAFAAIILPFAVPLAIFTFFYKYNFVNEQSEFLARYSPELIAVIISPIYAVALIFYIASVTTNEAISIKTAWRLGFKFWLPYLALTMLVLVLVCAGLLLLIIPGMYLAVRYSFAGFELLFDRKSSIDAIKSSWQLTHGYAGVIFGGVLILIACFYIPNWILSLAFEEGSLAFWIYFYSAKVVESIFAALTTIFMFRVYQVASADHNESLDEADSEPASDSSTLIG